MNASKGHAEPTRATALDRITRQAELIENIMHELLAEVDIEQLSNLQRLNIAIKLMGQQTRILTLYNSCTAAESPQEAESLLAALMRQMRGEEEVE
ncbi:hypothetical protein EPA93_09230 [Ktedonosporobacter rubrisoli]|uniref:Uncharacterized protein n=1 Tax=Ktedonosporobacter rubrisoli TaxID=2509675 RepID=A0A4V0YYG9_KTERU|nr:hypothetical protein [Ktedonosporobacter rubrisoli]QBD76181.1 hypothetical protein EPA93_09230 [Ktedonosporobacter rubrisoli]